MTIDKKKKKDDEPWLEKDKYSTQTNDVRALQTYEEERWLDSSTNNVQVLQTFEEERWIDSSRFLSNKP